MGAAFIRYWIVVCRYHIYYVLRLSGWGALSISTSWYTYLMQHYSATTFDNTYKSVVVGLWLHPLNTWSFTTFLLQHLCAKLSFSGSNTVTVTLCCSAPKVNCTRMDVWCSDICFFPCLCVCVCACLKSYPQYRRHQVVSIGIGSFSAKSYSQVISWGCTCS